jgi:hypothetical protein
MTSAERDAALDGLRAQLCIQLRDEWALRCGRTRPNPSRPCQRCRRLRNAITSIRALDSVREQARDRSFMASLWMYIACGLTREEAVKRARDDNGWQPFVIPATRPAAKGAP